MVNKQNRQINTKYLIENLFFSFLKAPFFISILKTKSKDIMRKKDTISFIENSLLAMPMRSTIPTKHPKNIVIYSGLNIIFFISNPFLSNDIYPSFKLQK